MAHWHTVDSLAIYLGIPKSTIYKLIREKKLPAHKLGRAYRFDEEEVDTAIKSGSFGTGSSGSSENGKNANL